jgi:hypothetical protein
VRIILELRTRWTLNIGSQSPKALTPNTRVKKRSKEIRGREQAEGMNFTFIMCFKINIILLH